MKIVARDIYKSYGRKQIVKGADFEASSSECIGIIGRNGCGKTTLISVLAGVEKANSGELYIYGDDGQMIDADSSVIGYVPQVNPLVESLSVKDNLWLWCSDSSNFDKTVATYDFHSILGMKVSKMSGGMKRRLAIACAMGNAQPILILDEPTAALDIVFKELIHKEISKFKSAGGIIIMITHEQEEIDMCDRCYVMENGVLNVYNDKK